MVEVTAVSARERRCAPHGAHRGVLSRLRRRVWRSRGSTQRPVRLIGVFYNRWCRHGHLEGLAPMMFEAAN